MLLMGFKDKYRFNMQVSSKPMAQSGEAFMALKSTIARLILAKLRATKSI
jgi:hypothetical protein